MNLTEKEKVVMKNLTDYDFCNIFDKDRGSYLCDLPIQEAISIMTQTEKTKFKLFLVQRVIKSHWKRENEKKEIRIKLK